MKKVFNKNQLEGLKAYPNEVTTAIFEVISMLDDNYGIRQTEVEVNGKLGGYILIVEDLEDIKNIKESILKGTIAEYTDIIECSEGVIYTSSLFLISDEYAVVIIAPAEISKLLVEGQVDSEW